MPVYKDNKRGTWYVKYSYTDRVTGKRKQVLKRGFKTKRDGTMWLAEQTTKENPSAITFRQLAQKSFEYRQPKEYTKIQQTAIFENYVPFIDTQVDSITKADVMNWYTDLTKKGLSASTMNLYIRVTKSVLKFGNEFYGLPNLTVGLKKVKEPRKVYETWTPEEFNQFIQYTSGHYKDLFMFLFWTGCRKSEAMALQYTDFYDGKVHIQRQLDRTDKFVDLKTESSDRVLKLPPSLQAYLKPVLERCSEECPFVFGDYRPLVKSSLHKQFKQAIADSGVKEIRVHDLRHSFATMMIGNDVNIVAVSKYLGHKTIDQTLKTYAHLFAKADDAMIEKIDTLIKTG